MLSPIVRIILLLIFLFSTGLASFAVVRLPNFIVKEIIENYIITDANYLSSFYNDLLYSRYSKIFDNLYSKPIKEWRNDPEFINFAKYSIYYAKYFDVTDINFYTPNKARFMSNKGTDLIGIEEKHNPINLLDRVIKGEDISYQIISNVQISELNQIKESKKMVQVFVPIKEEGKLKIIIEILYDVSEIDHSIKKYVNIFGYGSIVALLVAYLLFGYSVKRNAKLIQSQHELNLQLEEAKNRAEEDNQQKSKFLANVSHELRTPLNAIIGFSDIILREELGPLGSDQYREYLTDINTSGSHLLSLINDILDYSKADAGKLQIDAVEVNLNKIIKTCIRIMQPRAEQAKVQLLEETPHNIYVNILADPKRLKQVLLNLLSNSVKFTPEDGKVTIIVNINEKEKIANIKVIDTGIGIAAKDIAKAMATFGQVDNKHSRKYEGTGLGLPLTKKLVELMNGKFMIESEVGYGTTITFSLPYISSINISMDNT